ncbi:cell wall-binding repeat-containing protein [Peptoclostridium sp. AF21-18]|uniref:cell wall-binding repeat-containing protein n=1 Tax=Peptoclostridium sp. AF21-18 TaxID=2292243 RepID=UPI000E47F5FA|nr:cell wall-binding repeat-containing protein [Peptoclostridium sp. AF21-18]RHQ97826.1 cell wall-binding repeat-containing protein [Peptoclostridium sp. AF21-18]
MELSGDITYGNVNGPDPNGHYIVGTNKETTGDGVDKYNGAPLYVGGDVTLILDSTNMNTAPQNVAGVHNSHVKGNVTVQAKAGYFQGIHGQREDASKSKVDGNIHIIAGDPKYENTNSICRIGHNWDIVGAGEKGGTSKDAYEVGKNVTVDTYKNVLRLDKYESSGVVGANNAIVGGNVTLNINASKVCKIVGLESGSHVKGNVNINSKEVILKDYYHGQFINDTYIYTISYGIIDKNATVNMNGGEVCQIGCHIGTIKGNSTINITGEPKFTLDTEGVWGQKVDGNSSNDKSVLNIDNANASIPIVGYFKTVNIKNNSNVALGNDKINAFGTVYDLNVNTGSKLITNTKKEEGKVHKIDLYGNVNMNKGEWISNGYTYIYKKLNSENSKINFKTYYQIGYEYKDNDNKKENIVFTSKNDNFIAEKNIYLNRIHGNAELDNTNLSFMSRTHVDGNWNAKDTILNLPKVEKNYDGTDKSPSIPLNINGLASGKTVVNVVNPDKYDELISPVLYENYITGFKENDNPVEKTFLLGNKDATDKGYYLKRVNDPGKNTHFMWQVAKDESLTLDYKFVSEDGKKLPDNILNDEPKDEVNHHKGDSINKDYADKQIKKTYIAVENGVWHFEGWAYKEDGKYHDLSKEPIKMEHNVELIGVWHFEPKSTGGGGGTIVTPPTDPDRIEGNDRIETSVETSKDLYPNGTNAVVLANAERYTDVLTADPFAIQEKASALLTYKYELPEKTLKEIERLGAKKIYISGGYDAVSKKVVNELAAKGYEIFRFDGVDRYDTARKIAIKIREKGNTNAAELASGEDFPDALCMTPLAVKDRAPILLTKKDSIPKYTKQALAEWDIENIKIGGLDKAVSPEVEKQLKAGFEIEKNNKKDSNVYDGAKVVKRIGGEDRYETSAKLAKESYPESKLGVYATGEDFPDALIAGNYAGTKEAPVLLVKGDSLPEPIEKYTKESKIKKATIIGGVNAVSDKVFNLIKAAINK